MNKKGESNQGTDILGLSPNFLIGLIVAGLIIAGIGVPLIIKPLKMIFTDPDEQVNEQNFQRLVGAMHGDKETIVMNLAGNAVIVGFNKDWDDTEEVDWCGANNVIVKPKQCQGACVCLFKSDSFNKPNCKSFPDVDYIVGIPYREYDDVFEFEAGMFDRVYDSYSGTPMEIGMVADGIKYGHLVMYADCGKEFLTMNTYIDNFVTGGKKAIFISPENKYTIERLKDE